MRSLFVSLFVLTAPWSMPAFGQAQPPATQAAGQPSTPVSAATAATLARTAAPGDLMISAQLEQSRLAILALPTVDEDAKQLEAEYPGLYAALWAEIGPEMRRQAEADYPSYWASLEQIYMKRLTENEAQAVIRFFKSPTGQKLIRTMYGSVDTTPMLAEMVQRDDYRVNEQQMKAMTDAAKAKAAEKIGEEDHADLWILATSIKIAKFQALGAEVQKVTLDWINKEDPEGEEKLTQLMQAAMDRYIDAHPSKK